MRNKIKWIQWLSVAVLLLIMAGITIWANTPMKGEVPTAASKVIFEKAHVVKMLSEQASPDTWTEGLRLGTQEVQLHLDSGAYKGKELYGVNYLGAYGNVDLKLGTKVIVRMDKDENGNPYVVSVVNYNRSGMLIGLALLFGAALVIVGGKKGLAAIVGLMFTLCSIWFFLIPLIKRGVPVIPATIMLVAITAFVSLLTLNGFSKKTLVAVIGCVGGVTVAGLIAYSAGLISPINGFNMSEAEDLVLRATDSNLRISGLLVCGVLIASLGAVMDVALSIASAVSELHDMNEKAQSKELFRAGLNIGRDMMGTMANTLILAFAGASLNMLVLFKVFDYPYMQIFNSDLMTLEIIQGLAGSIGIILTVPLVALLSAVLFAPKHIAKKAK